MGLGTMRFFPRKRAPFERNQIYLQHGVHVDQVVERTMLDRGLPGLLVEILVTLQRLDERAHLIRSYVGDHINVL